MQAFKSRALGSSDAVGIIAAGSLLLLFGLPTIALVRNLSKSDQCRANLRVIGVAAKFYANDNNEQWMNPPFRRQAVDHEGIDYLASSSANDPTTDPGAVGFEREFESTSDGFNNLDAGSTALSTTRAFWLLVRTGELDTTDFICPVSQDTADDAPVPAWYHDFAGYDNISYGYQVPFGPRNGRPSESANSRQVFAADKGPFYVNSLAPVFDAPNGNDLTLDAKPAHWRRFNSPNHHGKGQNVLFVDASASFVRTPTVGIHHDNIYTLMTDEWDVTGFNRLHGQSPHFATVAEFPYPGQGALGPEAAMFAATDSLVYP